MLVNINRYAWQQRPVFQQARLYGFPHLHLGINRLISNMQASS